MDYKLNASKLINSFSFPSEVVDKHIKLAGGLQLKVLLYCFNNPTEKIDANNIASKINATKSDVLDALGFWGELGYFEGINDVTVSPKKVLKKDVTKPSRIEIAELAENDDKIKFILSEAQIRFGRLLRGNETSTLIWLYVDEGLSPAVILMAIDYAISINKGTIGYIEKLCIDWLNSGVDNIAAAEERIATLYKVNDAWSIVSKVFGLTKRSPSKKEADLCYKWVYTFGFNRPILKEAYDKTVDNIGQISMKYIDTILESYHSFGVKDVLDIEKLEAREQKSENKKEGASYDKQKIKERLFNDYN